MHAQNGIVRDIIPVEKGIDRDRALDRTKLKNGYEAWKRPGYAASVANSSLTSYVSFFFPDSNVLWVGSNNTYYVSLHAHGAVFDPTDPIFELDEDYIKLSRFDDYIVDSVSIGYLYVRHVDSVLSGNEMVPVVDSLHFQFYDDSQLAFMVFDSLDGIYAKPNSYNPSILASDESVYNIVVPLTKEYATGLPNYDPQSATWGWNWLTFDIPDIYVEDNSNLDGSNVCAWTLSYKTMLEYSNGDTLEATDGRHVEKRLNYFGEHFWENASEPLPMDEHYNHALYIHKGSRYGDTIAGFSGYIPGTAFSLQRFTDYEIHIKTDMLSSVQDLANSQIGIYPNPVRTNQDLMMDFYLQKNDRITLVIKNQIGTVIETVADGFYLQGEHEFNVNIYDYPAGIYHYTFSTSGGLMSGTFVVVD